LSKSLQIGQQHRLFRCIAFELTHLSHFGSFIDCLRLIFPCVVLTAINLVFIECILSVQVIDLFPFSTHNVFRDLVNEGLFDIISDILQSEDKRLVLTG